MAMAMTLGVLRPTVSCDCGLVILIPFLGADAQYHVYYLLVRVDRGFLLDTLPFGHRCGSHTSVFKGQHNNRTIPST